MTDFRPTRFTVLKEEFMALTRNTSQAILLDQFLHWTRQSYEFDELLKEENDRREKLKLPLANVAPHEGWFHKNFEALSEESMVLSSETSIKGFLTSLMDRGWVERRQDPFSCGKDFQYRVNLEALHRDLTEIGFALPGFIAEDI